MSPRLCLSSAAAQPERDLAAEVNAIEAWLRAHAAVTPNAVSREAGLSRNSLGNLLRANEPERPTAQRLDKLYVALRRYGFVPEGPGLPEGLTTDAVAQLLRLLRLGYVLTHSRAGGWCVRPLDGDEAGPPVSSGPSPGQVLREAWDQLAPEGSCAGAHSGPFKDLN